MLTTAQLAALYGLRTTVQFTEEILPENCPSRIPTAMIWFVLGGAAAIVAGGLVRELNQESR